MISKEGGYGKFLSLEVLKLYQHGALVQAKFHQGVQRRTIKKFVNHLNNFVK
jgi:hypothetical protein